MSTADLMEQLNGIHLALSEGDVQKAFIRSMILRTDYVPNTNASLDQMYSLGAHILFAVERADGETDPFQLRTRYKLLEIAHNLLNEVCDHDEYQSVNHRMTHSRALENVLLKLRDCADSPGKQRWFQRQMENMHEPHRRLLNDVELDVEDMPNLLDDTSIFV